ncbi:DUF397 domain-containing protein [Streptomyces sp. NPDC058579]|uniref:DUF397 domain-containing protein n=1 Tax=Streptomyces sp. NPDC058579 TaxID=3346548 RepID=UPI00364855B7
MGTSQVPRWRKSSYSGADAGDCIECAPVGSAAWRKSSCGGFGGFSGFDGFDGFGGFDGGECIEVADLAAHVAVRDSKAPEGPAFLATPAAFTAFVTATAGGFLG